MTAQGKTGAEIRYKPGYEKIAPLSNYAPWTTDAAFQRVYETIREHTMVDIFRCYMLWSLVGQAAQHRGDVLEIGVWRGGTGALIARRVSMLHELNRAVHNGHDALPVVFLADTFSGVVKAGPKDDYYRGGEHANTSSELVRAFLDQQSIANAELLQGVFPEDTGESIADRTFSFCHIDVDVYQSAHDSLEWVWPRMANGGIVVYDDYGFYGCEGVTRHVNEEFPRPDRVVVHNLSGQAVMIKTSP